MAETSLHPDGFFARGIETITHRARPTDHGLPELPGLQRLAPPDWQRPPALEQLLAGHALDRHIDEAILEAVPVMDRNLWVLDTAVTLGPLLGLLGTIFGMVKTFNVLGSEGMGAGAGAVTGGIGEALVATGVGLFIAIVGLIFLNYFNKRVRLGVQQMELIKLTVVNRLHGGGAR